MPSSILARTKPITSRDEYLALAKQYHPDNGGSVEAFQHIQNLYHNQAQTQNSILVDGIKYTYQTHFDNIYIGTSSVLFTFDKRLPHTLPAFSYADDAMKAQISPHLPVQARSGPGWYILAKPKRLHPLRPNIGKITPPHATWIVSSLYNLLCYLEWAGIVHNNLDISSIFIDPTLHTAHLLGGWWYSSPLDAKLRFLPTSTPVPKDKIATHRTDLLAIKRLAIELLGWPTDQSDNKIRFLRSPTSGSAITDYKAWMESLGPRKFVKLEL